MKKLKTLKASWFLSAMVVSVVVGELLRRLVVESFAVRVPALPVGAIFVGLTAFVISLIYDGTD